MQNPNSILMLQQHMDGSH